VKTVQLELAAEDVGERIDVVVAKRLSLPRAKVKALFEAGRVRIGNKKAKKGDELESGRVVSVDLPEEGPALVAAPELSLNVLHEDDALVFVDKPARVPSHPLQPGETGTVANALVARYPELASVGDDPREAGLCHRLDVETSGVLLAARTPEAWTKVREAFDARRVDKRYLALVTGPLGDEGEIDLPLAHSGDHVRPALGGGGRDALSKFRVLARAGSASLVEVQILTGVLHQVRAHLAAVGAPVWNDAQYGGTPDPTLGRFFLHAAKLSLAHPTTGKTVSVESPLPPELKAVLERQGLSER
jgi:23S rRNA pseudouridine1911/1915/1917 synthase